MTKFTGFANKAVAAAFRSELNAVLAKYGADANLEFTIGTIRFTSSDAKIQIETKVKGAVSREDRVISNLIASYGLKEIGRNGEKLVSYNSRAHRYPVIYSHDGKKYKTSLEHMKVLFAK
jgi:hypothetical protein